MNNRHFHEVNIDADDHRLISADSDAYDIFDSDMSNALEEYVDEEYRDVFLKNVELSENKWFMAKIRSSHGLDLFYLRVSNTYDVKMKRITIVSASELMESYDETNHYVTSYRTQLGLYDDVFYEYNPSEQKVYVTNTGIAAFDAGVYSLEEFEELLSKRAGERQKASVKKFIDQIKSKTGRFTVRIDSNLLNDDPLAKYTILEGTFAFYGKETEGVVGHIHLGNESGRIESASIKHDSLTGLVDKTDIIRIAQERINIRRLEGTTIAIIDIDFFKSINDNFGHQIGDEVIKKIADIISAEVGNDGIAGRFGGDEFFVVFYNIQNEDVLRAKLKNIKNLIAATFADKGPDENTPLSVSIGSATFPKDADNYEDVFLLADYCLYIAKDKGRNRYIIYTLSKHGSLEDVREKKLHAKKINERDLSYGDILVKMFDMTLHGKGSSIEHFMDEFAETFNLQSFRLFVGEPFVHRYTAGEAKYIQNDNADVLVGFLNSEAKDKYMGKRDFIVVNRIETMPPQAKSMKAHLKERGIMSFMMLRFYDKDGKECVLVVGSIGKQVQWNQSHFKYYRAFADLLGLYSVSK